MFDRTPSCQRMVFTLRYSLLRKVPLCVIGILLVKLQSQSAVTRFNLINCGFINGFDIAVQFFLGANISMVKRNIGRGKGVHSIMMSPKVCLITLVVPGPYRENRRDSAFQKRRYYD